MRIDQPRLQYEPYKQLEPSDEYLKWAEEVVNNTPHTEVPVLYLRDMYDPFDLRFATPDTSPRKETDPHFGIRWYETNPQREAAPGHTPETVVFYAPHSDDAEIAAGVSLTHQIHLGDHVSALHFTMGNAGRTRRGFTQDNMGTVRMAEAIAAGQFLGTQRVGIMMMPDGRMGFPEWFNDQHSAQMRMLGIALMRQLNPHILYSPHPDMRVDKHPDHVAVAALAAWGHGWGTENDFYAETFAGKANQIREWRRYAIWTGESTLPVNTHFRYDPEGPYARHKHAAVSMFQSQGGTIYADAALALDRYYGGMIGVGDDDGTAREKFDVVRSTTVVTPQWRD